MTREEMIKKLEDADRQEMIQKLERQDKLESMKQGRDVETTLKTAADDFLLGYTPQIVGAFDAATSDKPYVQARDEYRKELEMLQEANPTASKVGTGLAIGAGFLVPAGALGQAGKGALALKGAQAAQKATRLGRIAQAAKPALVTGAKTGAAYGLLSNPGDVEGEVTPLQIPERITGGLIGAGGGALAGGIMGGGSQLLSEVSEGLKTKAAKRAFKALKPAKKHAQKYGSKGQDVEIGQAALDEGIITKIPRTKEKLLERVQTGLNKTGDEIGSVIDELSTIESTLRSQGQRVGIDKPSIAKRLQDEFIDELESGDPTFNEYAQKRINNFLKAGDRDLIDIKTAQDLRKRLGDSINWKKIKTGDATERDLFNLKLYGILNDAQMDAADGLSSFAKKGVKETLKKARKEYANLKPMQEILKDAISSGQSTRTPSLTDYLSLVGGAGIGAAGGPLGVLAGPALAGLNYLSRNFGSQALAKGYQGLSSQAAKGSGLLQRGAQKAGPGLLGSKGLLDYLEARK